MIISFIFNLEFKQRSKLMSSRRILTAMSLLFLVFPSWAQHNLTLYHMQSVPQSQYVNPANAPDAKWFFGLPAGSSFHFGMTTSGLDLPQIESAFVPIAGTDSFRFVLNKMSNMLSGDLFLGQQTSVDLLHGGFRSGNSFWTFNVTEKVKSRLDVPQDIFSLILNGNGGPNLGRTFDFSVGMDVLHMREYAVGFQHSMMDDLVRFGVRAKYLYGLSTFTTDRNNVTFTTLPEAFTYQVKSDIAYHMASSVIPTDSLTELDALNYLYGSGNYGYGLDLGVAVNVTDFITVSASVVDLGSITWRTNALNVQSINPGASIEFKGLDLQNMLNDSIDMGVALEDALDSVARQLQLDTTELSFSSSTLPEFYLGANFHFNRNHNVGALFYGDYYNRKLYPSFTLSYNGRYKKLLGYSLSYSMMRRNFINLGAGLSINGKAFQWYIVGDNLIPSIQGNVKNLNVRSGINFTFGRRVYEARFDE